MSLREEIENRIQRLIDSDGLPPDCYPSNATDDILKLFEKGIDQIINNNIPETQKNLTIQEKTRIQYYILGLNDVKEILK